MRAQVGAASMRGGSTLCAMGFEVGSQLYACKGIGADQIWTRANFMYERGAGPRCEHLKRTFMHERGWALRTGLIL